MGEEVMDIQKEKEAFEDGDCIKDGMTQMAQVHHLVISMIQADAEEPSND